MPVRGCLLAHSTALWFLVLNVTVPIASGAREDAAMSALGYQPGQLLFGQFRILEYLGSAPLKHASPLPPRRRLPGDEGHQRADEGATGAAGEHGRPLRANATAAIIKEHVRLAGAASALIEEQARPAAEAAGDPKLTWGKVFKGDGEYLGTGTFGECYKVTTKEGQVITVKILYLVDNWGKARPITPRDLHGGVLRRHGEEYVGESVADSVRECRLLQRLHENAAKSKKDVAGIMKCHSIELPQALLKGKDDGLEKWFQQQPLDEETQHMPIYMQLSYCGEDTLLDAMGSTYFNDLNVVKYAIVKLAGPLQLLSEFFIVHRDLKPENVMFMKDEQEAGGFRLTLVDFGLAEQLSQDVWNNARLSIAGTPGYMPPEYLMHSSGQLRKLTAINVDARAAEAFYYKDIGPQRDERYEKNLDWSAQGIDVFALAVMTFEMLTSCRLVDLYFDKLQRFLVGNDAVQKFAAFNFFFDKHIEKIMIPQLSKEFPKWKTAMSEATFMKKGTQPDDFLHGVLLPAVHHIPSTRGEVTPAHFFNNAWLKDYA